jgi:hypothetical protein
VSDRICLRLGRRAMNTVRTIEADGKRPVVHVAGRHEFALGPSRAHPQGPPTAPAGATSSTWFAPSLVTGRFPSVDDREGGHKPRWGSAVVDRNRRPLAIVTH